MGAEDITKLAIAAHKAMNNGDYDGALSIAREICALDTSYPSSFAAAGIMIDSGSRLVSEGIVRNGIKLLEDHLDELSSDKSYAQSALYNLANGYSSLAGFKMIKDRQAFCFADSELTKAKELYVNALSFPPKKVTPEILVNLGNCYDHIGRSLDALKCYEKALSINKEHAMALGNKGFCLCYYAGIVDEHRGTYLREAYSLISKALEPGVDRESEKRFRNMLLRIEKSFTDKSVLERKIKYPGYKIESDSDIERFLIEYCLKNRLFLNICNYCQRCNAAIGDPVAIRRMVIALKKDASPETGFRNDPYLKLSRYINHIKQSFVASRFLLILSQYDELDINFVDKRVRIINTLDYSEHNIRVELLKKAFKDFYDILDKVAAVINEYLGLGIRPQDVDFRRVWFQDKKKHQLYDEVTSTCNFRLNAVFDIYRDLEDGHCKPLRLTRHALTHRFVNIWTINGIKDEENMSRYELLHKTLQLAEIVRNVVIYLLSFIDFEERKKEAKTTGPLLPLFAIDIPDELK